MTDFLPDRVTVITAGLVLAGALGVEALAAVAAPPLPAGRLATAATILWVMPVYILAVAMVHKIAWRIDAALARETDAPHKSSPGHGTPHGGWNDDAQREVKP